MVEFAIVFPVVFLLFLVIVQTALLMTARQVVHYAAFSAARSAIVGDEDNEVRAWQRRSPVSPYHPSFSHQMLNTLKELLKILPRIFCPLALIWQKRFQQTPNWPQGLWI